MKKFLAFLLCMAMVLSCGILFTACDKKGADDKDDAPVTIIGSWESTIEFGEIMEEIMFAEGNEVPEEYKDLFDFSGLKLTMILSFDEEGKYESSIDEESAEEMMDALLEMLSKAMKELLTEQLKEQGVSLEEYLGMMNMTWDELMEESFPRDTIMEDLDLSETGTYKIDGNKLYFDDEEDEYTEFTMTSRKLSFTKVVAEDLDDDEMMGILDMLLPLEFTRKG